MKRAMLLLFLTSLMWAAEPERTTIGDRSFEKQGNVWVQTNLPAQYSVTPEHSAIYLDSTWTAWFAQGSPELKMILELGPNVVFSQENADGQSVYRVRAAAIKATFSDSPKANPLFGANQAFSGLTQAGAVLVDINLANDDTSQDAKK